MPGVLPGTRIMARESFGPLLGSVRQTTEYKWHPLPSQPVPLVVKCFSPFNTQLSPSRIAKVLTPNFGSGVSKLAPPVTSVKVKAANGAGSGNLDRGIGGVSA